MFWSQETKAPVRGLVESTQNHANRLQSRMLADGRARSIRSSYNKTGCGERLTHAIDTREHFDLCSADSSSMRVVKLN